MLCHFSVLRVAHLAVNYISKLEWKQEQKLGLAPGVSEAFWRAGCTRFPWQNCALLVKYLAESFAGVQRSFMPAALACE